MRGNMSQGCLGSKLLYIEQMQFSHESIVSATLFCIIVRSSLDARRVLTPSVFLFKNISQLRVLYYMTMSLVKDNAKVQRQGIVHITYQIGCQIDVGHQFRQKEILLRNVLPLKVAADHSCTDDPAVHLVVKLLRPLVNLHNFCRLQLHLGTSRKWLRQRVGSFHSP